MNVKLHVVAIALIVTAMFVFECDTKKDNHWNCHRFMGHDKDVCRYGRGVYKDLIENKNVDCEQFEKNAFSQCTTNETYIKHREYMYVCVHSEFAHLCNNREMKKETDCIIENCSKQFGTGFGMYHKCVTTKCNADIPEYKTINYWNCHSFEGNEKSVCKYGRAVYKQLGEANLGCHNFEQLAFQICRYYFLDWEYTDICVRDLCYSLCNNTVMHKEMKCINENVLEYCMRDDVDEYYSFGIYSKCVRAKCNISTPNSSELKINFWNCQQFKGHKRTVCKYGQALYKHLLKVREVGCGVFEARAFLSCTKDEEIVNKASMDLCVRTYRDYFCQTSNNSNTKINSEWQESYCIWYECEGWNVKAMDFNKYSECVRRECNLTTL